MSDWPGEKLDLFDCVVLGGSKDPYDDLLFPLDYSEDPDTSVTLVAGDDFVLWSDTTDLLLDADPIGTCNWIIEATEGGAIEISTGHDPGWLGTPGPWTSAGASVSTGRNVVPLPIGDRTFDWLTGNNGGLLLRLTVMSGTVTLSSVRLQAEPPGGLLIRTGWEWSDYFTPALVNAPGDKGQGQAGTGATTLADDGSSFVALDLVRSGSGTRGHVQFEGTPPPNTFRTYFNPPLDDDWISYTGEQSFSWDRAWSFRGTPKAGNADLQIGYSFGLWRERPTYRRIPVEMESVTPGRDFEKIDSGFSWESYGEFGSGDTVAVEWGPPNVEVSYFSPTLGELFDATIALSHSLLLSDTGGDYTGSFSGWPPPLGSLDETHLAAADFVDDTFSTYIPLSSTPPPGSDFTVTVIGELAEDGAYPAAGYAANTDNHVWNIRPDITIHYQLPDFRYHVPVFAPDPDAVPALAPRFYVKDQVGQWRPVGFGKPANELSMLRANDPGTGTYRDLTPAEYLIYGPETRPPGGFPLNVKREDGVWDQVGWMLLE